MRTNSIKNIIFDLGGVIINLSEERTLQSFSNLSGWTVEDLREQILNGDLYKKLEKGMISPSDFRDGVRGLLNVDSPDGSIDEAMNAMLLDIPTARIDLLKNLGNRFRLFLLSNTNEIHFEAFNRIVKETTGEKSINIFFEKAYYSHLVHMRKPDVEIYELVVSENALDTSETLFLDDNAVNLKGAESLGIQTVHVNNSSIIFDLFG
ncbi:MAG: HAD family phosphatase [Cyclobacteriaceae bacterium]